MQSNGNGGLWRRARAYAALTPGERALLRLAEGLLCAGLVAALPVIAAALGHQPINWSDLGRAALAAAATAMLLALNKYLRAHGDPPLTA
ncbi:MAG TPA: hypothetical protein VHI51_10880 [Ktedonobacterales bacterium]|jgi:hypothetical protein|nr:hypothetical protein [Ktedonobacterales bacterium]